MQQTVPEDDPIVIGGGPCTYNPEPLADFFDMFYIGEGETQYFDALLDLYKECKAEGESQTRILHEGISQNSGYLCAVSL